jgi:hypothetical protein
MKEKDLTDKIIIIIIILQIKILLIIEKIIPKEYFKNYLLMKRKGGD